MTSDSPAPARGEAGAGPGSPSLPGPATGAVSVSRETLLLAKEALAIGLENLDESARRMYPHLVTTLRQALSEMEAALR